MLLKPKRYNRAGSTKKELGLIADDVAKLVPELASDMNGNLGLNYDGFVPILVRAMQQQQAQIDALNKRLGAQ
jgi:hypothetical protein